MYNIRRIGTAAKSKHDGSFSVYRPNGYDCYLALFVKTKAVFYLDGERVVSEPNSFILFNIRTPHRYGAYGDEYVNDWLHFETDELPAIPLDTLIPIGNAANISEYFELMSDAFYRCNYQACKFLLRAVLSEVAEISGNSVYRSAYSAKLIELRKSIYAHPEQEWSIGGMAERLHVSKPYFQEIYKAAFSVTCGADVISARIEAAKLLMTDTDLPISEIGERCGYESVVHFSRQFKKITGVSPSAYRMMYK